MESILRHTTPHIKASTANQFQMGTTVTLGATKSGNVSVHVAQLSVYMPVINGFVSCFGTDQTVRHNSMLKYIT